MAQDKKGLGCYFRAEKVLQLLRLKEIICHRGTANLIFRRNVMTRQQGGQP